ncbi:protein-glutamine gamma-glutamyltransferase 4-like [Sapajus apella]|uniref:Protein-glutamine gamma-glutamyltransferase 4-like n=1 Tax=Sapajus apella TaxID=9515 RepID=A0A6J3JHJ7_SAPAP|nr:protein-glutamine gamma-glutamyltransferase 4-like [Sapajus apella]
MDASKELQVLHVDFLKQENAISHHTREFQTSSPVFRRGQVFHLRLALNQPLQSYHELKLQFGTGLNPSIARHTLVELNPRTPSDHHNWQASLHEESGKEVSTHRAGGFLLMEAAPICFATCQSVMWFKAIHGRA